MSNKWRPHIYGEFLDKPSGVVIYIYVEDNSGLLKMPEWSIVSNFEKAKNSNELKDIANGSAATVEQAKIDALTAYSKIF